MKERKYFIKDLFDPKKIINRFNYVEFKSFRAFIDCYMKDLFVLGKQNRFTIPINSLEEFEQFGKISQETLLCETAEINLFIKPDLLNKIFQEKIGLVVDKKFNITTTKEIKHGLDDWGSIENFRLWTQYNPLWINIEINYNNFRSVVEDILKIYNTQKWRFFWLKFDYESFEEMKFKELHELEFWLNQLIIWVRGTKDKKYKYPHIETNNWGFKKKIIISEDLKLYLGKKMWFDIGKYIDCNGEEVPFKELNILRSYIDLVPEALIPKMNDLSFIDFYQNYKIMGHINEIPYITKIIGDKLGFLYSGSRSSGNRQM